MSSEHIKNEDIKLILALQQGDIFAFNALFRKYSQKIFNFALKHLEQEEDVEDLVQDVFITIWNRRQEIDEKQSFNGYLFAITLNAIRKHFRKKVKNRRLVEKWLEDTKAYSDITDFTVEYKNLKERADIIINELPPKRKTVFLLSREQGLRTDEIAEKMEITKKTVENHLNLALRYLREKLMNETFLLILFFVLFY